MPDDKRVELKGVIPPKNSDPNALLKALQELQEFLRQFPGLAEEVMKAREQDYDNSPSSTHYRDEFPVGHRV